MNTAIKERPIFEMIPVVSSQIASIGHDAASNMLAIQFPEKKDGSLGNLYHYENVSTELFAQFIGAESIGSFFINNIKKFPDLYPYTRIS